ncbi:DUF2306 domain-containing protein [Henriciella sp. AS95]|uniref:DUF2306 domain-containing protein n=1 Tax=Henriciella sp. AS95 TaxID=3135782 RepID=UPI003177F1F0
MSSSDYTPAPVKLGRPRLWKMPKYGWTVGLSLLIYTVLTAMILRSAGAMPRFRFDPAPIIESGIAIQVHVTAALVTLAIGVFLLVAPKGFRMHRTFGWAWVMSMGVTAASSFFIMTIFQNFVSPIHALSAWTLLGLPFGIAAVKRREIAKHRKTMTDMFVGGMVVAGMFSLLPGRMLWDVFFAM